MAPHTLTLSKSTYHTTSSLFANSPLQNNLFETFILVCAVWNILSGNIKIYFQICLFRIKKIYFPKGLYEMQKNTPFVRNYKNISTNSHLLRSVINLVNHIQCVNYLYYHSKIIIFLPFYPFDYFSLMFEERILSKGMQEKHN